MQIYEVMKMKGLVCRTCGHIEFGEAPNRCPVCDAKKGLFSEQDVIKTETDVGLKAKHLPVIETDGRCGSASEGGTDIRANIGSVPHPMELKHHIRWVDFYVDREWLCRVHLTPGCNAAASAHIRPVSGRVSVIELCSIHGYWLSELQI